MRPEWWSEAQAERARSREVAPCVGDHTWRRYSFGGVVLILICQVCGRNPNEALDATIAPLGKATRNGAAVEVAAQ